MYNNYWYAVLNRIFILCIALSTILLAQKERQPILFESHVFPSDSSEYKCYILFKIPYDQLVFTRESDYYTGGVNLNYEILKEEEIYKRVSSSKSIQVDTYENTHSDIRYLQGVTSFFLEPGEYKILPSVNLQNTRKEIPLREYSIDVKIDHDDFYFSPIVCYSEVAKYLGSPVKELANFSNTIPFSLEYYDIILPVAQKAPKNLKVELIQNNSTVFEYKLSKSIKTGVELVQDGNEIYYFLNSDISEVDTYLLPRVSKYLKEGSVTLKIYSGEKVVKEFELEVVWRNRPFVLSDINLAVDLYEKVTDDPEVERIFDAPEEEYYHRFFDYWAKYDPKKETVYNELMDEFYSRADIAHLKYKTANNVSGVKTDRGRTFVKYGEPDSVERHYEQTNNIVEVWNYEKMNKEFIFEDRSGLGNYILTN